MTRHNVSIEQTRWSAPAGIYAICTCGWFGTVQHALDEAMDEHKSHVFTSTTKRAETA